MDFIAVFPCNLEDYMIIAICATSRLGLRMERTLKSLIT